MPESKTTSDLIWGIHPVLELLQTKPQQVQEITIQKSKGGPKIQEIITLAKSHNRKIRFSPFLKVPGIADANHQGVIARIAAVLTLTLDDLLAKNKQPGASPLFLTLDSIQDPHNLGAIIRSASAAGANGIILPKDRSAPLGGTAAKAAAGAISHMDICQVTNLVDTLKRLKEEGFWIYGTAAEAEKTIYQTEFDGPICLVTGSEEKGLRPLVRKHCDFLVSIPMRSTLDSLNASVATAVILYEILRQRLQKK